MNIEEMETAAERVSELMKVLSHKSRLLILCQLASGDKSVGELAELLGSRMPAISQQLALLRKDGLVTARREGQTIYYALARQDISHLMEFLYRTYCANEPVC